MTTAWSSPAVTMSGSTLTVIGSSITTWPVTSHGHLLYWIPRWSRDNWPYARTCLYLCLYQWWPRDLWRHEGTCRHHRPHPRQTRDLWRHTGLEHDVWIDRISSEQVDEDNIGRTDERRVLPGVVEQSAVDAAQPRGHLAAVEVTKTPTPTPQEHAQADHQLPGRRLHLHTSL